MRHPIAFTTTGVLPETSSPAPDNRVLRGHPQQIAWNHDTDATGPFSVGLWQGRCDPHAEAFCMPMQVRLTLTADGDTAQTFQAGDAFVVHGGFSGIWKNLTLVRKDDAIMAPQNNET